LTGFGQASASTQICMRLDFPNDFRRGDLFAASSASWRLG
jgi:hypothetical protein